MPPNTLERFQDTLTDEQAAWIRTRKEMTDATPHLFGRIDRLSLAAAEVEVLDMPSEVLRAVEAANSYVERLGEERTDELKAEWSSIYERLHTAKPLLMTAGGRWWRRARPDIPL